MAAVGLAAIGTIADIVPLLDENRALVRHGLRSLKAQPLLGLAKLMKIAGLDDKESLVADDIGFTIAPRLNAAGRLGQAQLAIELLTTEDSQRADALAEYLSELNHQRDSLERSIYLAANKQIKERFDPENEPALVLAARGWHPGIVGIVASRLVDKYHRPVVMIAQDSVGVKLASGSARTACGVNLHQALLACTEHLVSHGGHAAAAGLRIDDAHIEAFREAFCEYVAGELSEESRTAEVRIDAEAPFSQLTLKTVEQIESLAPFGQANPRPVLCCSDIRIADPPRKMGSGERHLTLKLSHGRTTLRSVAFGKSEWAEELEKHEGPLEVAYRPVINEFKGMRRVELQLVDWRPTRETATAIT
jgi:single-stranded-DNA-specific exonuclease